MTPNDDGEQAHNHARNGNVCFVALGLFQQGGATITFSVR